MRKKFYFATLVIAALSFTGCANDEYVGDQRNLGEQNGAIAFSTKSTNTVRAENSADADKLHRQFWVYGTKTVGENDPQPVFKDYKVVYDDGTTSSSNTSGWEYVGILGTTQTIKYWDYSADHYDFEAYSFQQEDLGTVSRNPTANLDQNLDVGDYKVEKVNENECATLYFAGQKTVKNNYKDKVTLDFKSVLSKIRVGFYETIPGYSVKIDKFYGLNDATSAWDKAYTDKFVALCPNNKIEGNSMSFVVSYNDNTPAITKVKQRYNSVDKYRLISNAGNDYTLNQELTLGTNLKENTVIGESYSEVTWDNNTSKYTYVIPQNQVGNGQVKEMKIKVDYTLTSDKDHSGEVIKVTGATAIVPVEYVQWKPNTAYSYVFKISDNTNGNTGGSSDPAGLYPITFDAFVTEMEDYRDHLTTVSDLSITATQGKQFAEADKAVFKTGEAINVKVTYNNRDITSAIGSSKDDADKLEAAFVNSYKYDKSPEQNLTDNNVSYDQPDFANNVITLGSQTNAGYWIVKVTYNATTEGSSTEEITKYAVLKVGTETTSSTGGE